MSAQESRGKRAAAVVAVLIALALMVAWKPTASLRLRSREVRVAEKIEKRAIHVSPAELATLMYDRRVPMALFDLRDESAFNQFHLLDAQHAASRVSAYALLKSAKPRTIKFVIGSDETTEEAVARDALIHGIPNVYVLAGGMSAWLSMFQDLPGGPLREGALGDRHPASAPNLSAFQLPAFEKKVVLEGQAKKKSGGCG